jgi:signal transduction histidine kinase
MKERASGSRRLPASAWLFDSALALVAAGLATAILVPVVSEPVARAVSGGMLALGYGLVLLHTLPLAVRRRFPGTVLALCVASGLAFGAFFLPPFFLGPAILVAVYSVAAYGSRWVSLAGLAVAELGLAANQLTQGRFERLERSTFLLFMGIIAVAWVLGHFVGDRQLYAAQLEERTAELEQAREELARRAVAEERLRLARELHDVVAHAMSVIAVQSGVGAHVADSRPEEVGKALAAIEATSRAALTELRRLLGVLRQNSEPQASLTPVPGLANLDSLLAEVGKAGLAVRLRVEGTPLQLPAGVDLSAYRIVQEALTNVVKHAGPAHAQVTIGYRDQEVTVEVTDDGRGAVPPVGDGRMGTGHGLIGMRERVAAFGGDLQVGPRPAGGFRVAARLPLATGRQRAPG